MSTWIFLLALLGTHWITVEEIVAINIALNKTVTACNGETLSSILTDGDRNTSKHIAFDGNGLCWPEFFIQVNLERPHHINRVELFEGDPSPAILTGREMDYFEVRYSNDRDIYRVCNYYPNLSMGPSNKSGMNVNCMEDKCLCLSVRIVFTNFEAHGFNLAEIEVHEADFPNMFIYRGCYKNFYSTYIASRENVDTCKYFCGGGLYYRIYAMSKHVCFCDDDYDPSDEVSIRHCPDRVSGLNCGGQEAFAVYVAMAFFPSYQGCLYFPHYKKNRKLILASNLATMTIGICMKLCNNFNAISLVNGTSCYCTRDSYRNFLSINPKPCNVTCGGNPNTFCGGEHYASIYSTCTWQNHKMTKCTAMYKCKREMDEFGNCPHGCQHGWRGLHCMERDPSVDIEVDCAIDKPCDDVPNSKCIIKNLLFDCICFPGFLKDIDGLCKDIDECEEMKCDRLTSTCLNRIGSYYCECKEYTFRLSNFTCLGNATRFEFFTTAVLLVIPPILSALLTALVCCAIPPEQRKGMSGVMGKRKSAA